MNRMKTTRMFLITGILASVLAFVANAQNRQGMRMSPEEQVTVLKDSLALDSTQTVKVLAILTAQREEMTKIREAHQGDFQAMREEMMSVRKKTDDKIVAILTDDQKTKYEQMIKNRPTGGMRGRGGN